MNSLQIAVLPHNYYYCWFLSDLFVFRFFISKKKHQRWPHKGDNCAVTAIRCVVVDLESLTRLWPFNFFIFAVHALFNWINFAHLIKRVRACVRAREHERQRFAVSRNRYVAEYWMCNEHGFKFQLVDLWILCAHSMFPVFVFFFLFVSSKSWFCQRVIWDTSAIRRCKYRQEHARKNKSAADLCLHFVCVQIEWPHKKNTINISLQLYNGCGFSYIVFNTVLRINLNRI